MLLHVLNAKRQKLTKTMNANVFRGYIKIYCKCNIMPKCDSKKKRSLDEIASWLVKVHGAIDSRKSGI